jgi:hypothetical protein
VKGALLALPLLVLQSCSLPGLEKAPAFHFTPEFTLYMITGKASMQSQGASGPVDNAPNTARELGQNQRDAGDWGGTFSVGDGFSGLDFSYLHVDLGSTSRGTLSHDFGALHAGDTVWSEFRGDVFKVDYYGQMFEHKWSNGIKAQVGPGIVLAHHELRFKAVEVDDTRQQQIKLQDDVTPYAGIKARGTYRQFGLELEYAIDPGVHFGGDFDGVLQDYGISLRWALAEDQDVTLIVGYRSSDLKAEGSDGSLHYSADLAMDGYFFAVSLGF